MLHLLFLSGLPVLCPEMATEGTLWFSNLLLPDTTMILPLSMCLLNLVLLEVSFYLCLLQVATICKLHLCVSVSNFSCIFHGSYGFKTWQLLLLTPSYY